MRTAVGTLTYWLLFPAVLGVADYICELIIYDGKANPLSTAYTIAVLLWVLIFVEVCLPF